MGGFAIAEKFLSFQGEGIHSGRRAYFIRLFGCNVKCGWCDSKSAWEGAASETLSAREIAGAAMDSGAEIAVGQRQHIHGQRLYILYETGVGMCDD